MIRLFDSGRLCALVLLFVAAAGGCGRLKPVADGGGSDGGDAPVAPPDVADAEDATDVADAKDASDGLTDALPCPAGQHLAYKTAGCGAEAHPVCVGPLDDACAKSFCSCDGVTVFGCSHVAVPWRLEGACPVLDGGDGGSDATGDAGGDGSRDGADANEAGDTPAPGDGAPEATSGG